MSTTAQLPVCRRPGVTGNIIEIDVAASGGIVQPAVPILLDDDGDWFHLGLLYVAVHKGQIDIDTNSVSSYS
jgi:hypothetical protein